MSEPDPLEVPGAAAPTVVESPRRRVPTWLAALVLGLGVAALGGPAGLLWSWLAPRTELVRYSDGFAYANPESKAEVAADGTFALIGVGLGFALAALAWGVLRRHRGVAILVGLTVGSAFGTVLTSYVGYKVGSAEFFRLKDVVAAGASLPAPLRLRMDGTESILRWHFGVRGVATIQALIAAFVYTFLAGFSNFPGLRGLEPADFQPPYGE